MATATTLGGLNECIASVTAELAALRRRQRRSAMVPAGVWGTACLLHWSAEGGLDTALHFLVQSLPMHAISEEEWTGKLEAALERTPQDERVRLTTLPATVMERRRLHRAQKWMKESDLHEWLEQQNVGKGIAPVSSVLLQEANRLLGAAVEGPRGAPSRKSRLQWLRRWRRRWRVRLGRVQAADRPSADACARKATGGRALGRDLFPACRPGAWPVAFPAGPGDPSGRSLPNSGRSFGAIRWPRKRARLFIPQEGLGPKNGTVLGPGFVGKSSRRRRPCGLGATSCTPMWRRV